MDSKHVLDNYKEIISKEFPNVTDFGVTFFMDVESYVDNITPIEVDKEKEIEDKYNIIFHTYYDYASEAHNIDKVYSEVNRCTIGKYKFLKIITSYLIKEDSYDFIVAPNNDIKNILQLLKDKKDLQSNVSLHAPLIDLPVEEFNKDVFEFLLNKEFDEFCTKYNIKKKRAFILEGPCGNGKSLLLSWIKERAIEKNISVTSYSGAQDFMDNYSDLYTNNNKKIAIFEEFDTYVQERVKKGREDSVDSNPVLNVLLNLLDGIKPVSNIVFLFTTNYVQSLDYAFRRAGRIDRTITFKGPNEEQKLKFLNAYLIDYSDLFTDILKQLNNKSTTISYAMLKAITDNIRIKEFWNKQNNVTTKLELADISTIISQVIDSSKNVKEEVDTKKYVL